jgi:lipopolysaccharide transport system permease protein
MEYEIRPQGKFSIGLKELRSYNELFYFFTWRDIKVKYKQTLLGILWAIFQPIFMTTLFVLSFGRLITISNTSNIPYPIFVLSGFLLWNIFSSGLSNSGNSMVNNANIIKKIYFPRLIIPIASILVSLVDFIMAFLVFIPVLYFYDCSFKWIAIIMIPISILLTFFATVGLGIFLAAVSIKYRDFRYILPFFIQALLFATPVIYPIKIAENNIFQTILQLNPMNAPIELFRYSISDNQLNYQSLMISISVSLVLFFVGVIYFRKTESYFADLA